MRPMIIAAAALAGAFVLPTAAMARPGFVTASLSLRAGPGIDFPAVDRVPAGARVNIHGCIRGYRWCDVSFAGDRGWIDGDELQFLYRGRRVLIVDYGPEIDFPIIGFDVGSYWGHYYRGRDFYGRRDYWENRYQADRGGRDVTVGRGERDRVGSDRHERSSTIGRGGHEDFGRGRELNGMGGHERHGRDRDRTVGAGGDDRSAITHGGREHLGRHSGPQGMRSRGPETTGAAPRGAATTGAGVGGDAHYGATVGGAEHGGRHGAGHAGPAGGAPGEGHGGPGGGGHGDRDH